MGYGKLRWREKWGKNQTLRNPSTDDLFEIDSNATLSLREAALGQSTVITWKSPQNADMSGISTG